MPIFWWYLLKNYLKVLILSVFSFIAILLVIRSEEIAQFATIGAKPTYLLLFTLYQIPYILPIAIPISCLISAMILFQRMSHTQELTALRAGGIALRAVVTPILVAATFLSLTTFYITSELATSAHLATRKMVYDLTSINPLILLQSAKIAKLQGSFIQMDPIRNGAAAKDLIIAVNNAAGKRLNLCLAKQIEMRDHELLAKQVSIISSSPTDEPQGCDHLIIENQQWMSCPAPQLAFMLRKSGWKIANDHLKFSLLRARMGDVKMRMATDPRSSKVLKKCETEIVRRIAVALATFTFTLMGAAFGMQISRGASKRGIVTVLTLSALCLICFCIAKELDHLVLAASLLLLLPQALIIYASTWTLSRINRGIE